MIARGLQNRAGRAVPSLAAALLLVMGLASVTAAPRPARPGKPASRTRAPKPAVQRVPPPPHFGSVAALERYLRQVKKISPRVKTAYLEAYLWRMRQRAYPTGRVDWSAYTRAAKQRDRMPAARIVGSRVAGARTLALPRRWEYAGPNNLPVPYRIYYGEGATSGRVNGLAYDPLRSGVYWLASASGGVFKSTDSGQNWSFLSADWPFLETSCVAVHPVNTDTVYVGTGDFPGFGTYGYGIMKTTDGGQTWTNLGRSQFDGLAVSDIILDPENPDTIIAATGRGRVGLGRIWRSTDGGQTWTSVLSTQAEWSGLSLGVRSSSGRRWLYACGHAAGGEVWRSGDRGATWSKLTVSGLGTGAQIGLDVAASVVSEDTVYLLSGTDRKIYKSTDAGNAWTDTTNDFPNGDSNNGANYNWSQFFYNWHITCSRLTSTSGSTADVVYVGQIDLVQSIDGGANWKSVGLTYTDTALTHNDQHYLAINPRNANEALVGNDGGVYRLTYQPTSDAVTFNPSLNTRLGITQFYTGDWHPTDPSRMIGGTQDNATPVALGDLNNWRNVCGGDGAGCVINPQNPSIQYASAQNQFLCRTTDAWTTNQDITPNWGNDRLPFIGRLTLDPSNPNLVYAGTNYLWRYDASTGNWTSRLGNQELARGADSQGVIRAITVAPSNGDFLYVGSDRGELWASNDRGTSWRQINTGSPALPDRAITSIAVHPTNPRQIWVTVAGTGSGHVFRLDDSTAGSRAWADLSGTGATGVPDISANTVAVDPANPTSVIFLGNDVGVFRSRNGGQTWENMTAPLGLPNVEVTQLKVVPGTGYLNASTYGRGMWRIDPGAEQQGLELTAPNGDEIFLVGSQAQVTWNTFGITQPHNVRLELSRDGGTTWEDLAASTPDDEAFSWTVDGPATDTARLRITSLTDPTITDTTDADFRIVEGSFRVSSPNGGETLRTGRVFPIEWEATGFALTSARVKIELSRNNGGSWETLFGSTENDGTQNWTVAGSVSESALIRITPVTLPVFADTSDAEFRIRVPSVLTVTAPNGGEQVRVNDTLEIRWNAAGFDGNVRIDISRNGGASAGDWLTLFPSTPNDGRESWRVTGPATNSARIRVTSVAEPSTTDVSNGLFKIVQPELSVTRPTGGTATVVGATVPISWTSTGLDAAGNVRVEYSLDAGRSWKIIASSTPNSGLFQWTVPAGTTESALVRVTSLSSPVSGLSNRFAIRSPDLFVSSPNGGNRWKVGTLETITWRGTTVGSGTVDIQLSKDGGRTWATILSAEPNDGGARYGVRGRPTTRAVLRIFWNPNRQVQDRSDRVFTIRRRKK